VQGARSKLQRPSIGYSEWLYNKGAVIVAGQPDKAFLESAKSIQEQARLSNTELRLPWGAQITAARFTENRPNERLGGFFDIMRSAPEIGSSTPTAIDVGYLTFFNDGVHFETHERFDLGQS